MLWQKQKDIWQAHVVPVGAGIVRWNEVAAGLKDTKFNGTISLHGEYETKDLAERKKLAKEELEALKKRFA
jgi:sugar phosphate isomerase/epimerase